MSKNIPVPSKTQFELWARQFENHIKIYLMNDFRESGLDPQKPIDFETFKCWIQKDHNLYLSYAFKNVCIATSLLCLDEINYIENPNPQTHIRNKSNPSMNNNPSSNDVNKNYYKYPSFNF